MNAPDLVTITTGMNGLLVLAGVLIFLLFAVCGAPITERIGERAVAIGGVIGGVAIIGLEIWVYYSVPLRTHFEMTREYIACRAWPVGYRLPLDQVFHLRVDHYYKSKTFGRRSSGYNYHVVVAYLEPSARMLPWEGRDDGGRYVSCRYEASWGDDADDSRIHRLWQSVLQQRRIAAPPNEPVTPPPALMTSPDKSLPPPGRSFVISPSGKVTYE